MEAEGIRCYCAHALVQEELKLGCVIQFAKCFEAAHFYLDLNGVELASLCLGHNEERLLVNWVASINHQHVSCHPNVAVWVIVRRICVVGWLQSHRV